ncbi:hypothetical protein AK830_g10041 [Neonectria ditissima]|uniref:Uncharacterized protein n=1 Tax=Neonectria ditissima TaxID=78410 RepID=A0A0P7B7W9_9HYPO|nr:hypothetical protein AK830_g10041 [Neonectria ditissima]
MGFKWRLGMVHGVCVARSRLIQIQTKTSTQRKLFSLHPNRRRGTLLLRTRRARSNSSHGPFPHARQVHGAFDNDIVNHSGAAIETELKAHLLSNVNPWLAHGRAKAVAIMGFLSFLSRKTSSDRGLGRSIKTQAYDSTTAAHPPVRGKEPTDSRISKLTYALDKLQQAARKRSLAQLPVIEDPIEFENFKPAPSPGVSRFREDFDTRPNSAPDIARLNSRFRSARPISRGTSPATALRLNSNSIQKQLLPPVPPVPPIPERHHRRRRSSLESSQNRFIDILDAQGELKPANFRSRVNAAGAREFGEDVADRNIGENGHDLASPVVQAFYGIAGRGDSFDESAPPPTIAKARRNKAERSRIRQPRKRDSATSLSKVSDVSAWNSFSEVNEVDLLRPDYPRGRRTERHEEMQYANSTIKDLHQLMLDRRRSFHSFAGTHSKEGSRPRPLSLHPSMSNFHDEDAYPPSMSRTRPRTTGRGSNLHAIGNLEVEGLMEDDFDDAAPPPIIPVRARQARRRSSSYSESQNGQNELQVQPRFAQEPSIAFSRPSSSSSAEPSRPRTRSIGGTSVQQRHRLDDITEHIPVRTSSLGLQSQSCLTPTTISSAYSSNVFPRSQSQHTASTSIDASVPAPSDKFYEDELVPSLPRLGYPHLTYSPAAETDFSIDALGLPRRDNEENKSRLEFTPNLPTRDSPIMSNYVSGFTDDSDVDSFDGAQEHGVGEEGLLFNEVIYGASGGLPGLFDSFPNPQGNAQGPNRKMNRSVMSSPKSPQTKPTDRSRPRSSHTRPRAGSYKSFESRHAFTIDAQDLDAFLELEHAFLRSAGSMMASSLSANSKFNRRSMYEFEDDDDEEEARVDICTTTRSNKDLKRLDTATSRRSRRPKSAYQRRGGDDESGDAADTED